MAGLQNPRQAVVKGNFLHVRFPKWDKGLLTKVRMIPNRVFNGKSLFWSLKLSIEAINFVISEGFDIPDDSILVLAQKLDFLIKEESLKAERFATSKALTAAPIQEIACKMKLPAWDYQWAPVHYALMTDGAFILGDEMACISADSNLKIRRNNSCIKLTIQDLYKRFHGLTRHKWNDSPTYIWALKDKVFTYIKVKDVLLKGQKQTIIIETETGKKIECTPDHEICIDEWLNFSPANVLKIGQKIICNGAVKCPSCGTQENLISYTYSKFLGYCKNCMYRQKRSKPTYKTGKVNHRGYILVSGQWDHPHCDHLGRVREHRLVMEKYLGRYLLPEEEVHHKDENPSNNLITNLEVLTNEGHRKKHKKQSLQNLVRVYPKLEKIVSITKGKLTEVYDVVCDSPHNFVANGIVVHNCGKSVESLMVVNHSKWANKPVGIITKAPETYQKEIHKFFGQPSLILNEPLSQLYPNIRYYISSYDRMKNFFVDTDLFLPRDYCKDMFWIFDEAHLMKNPKTLRHQFGKEILKMTDQKLLMTGTPLPNRPEEIYSLLKLMFPTFMSKTQFMMQFMGVKYTENGMVSTGLTNYQQLNRWLYENVFIRRLKSQVQTQLPDKLRESYFIKDNPVYVQADSMLELFSKSAQMKSQDKDFLSWLEIVFEETQKVGVFAHHKCMIEAIEKICIKKGYGYVKIDGSTDPTTRQALADQFADNADKKVAILSMSVAGTGINGLQAADFCVFAEFNWVPGNMLQCEDRFHRPGLKNSLTILYSIYSQLEMELSQMLLEKLGVIQRVIGHEEIPDMVKKESLMQALSVKFGLPLGGIK